MKTKKKASRSGTTSLGSVYINGTMRVVYLAPAREFDDTDARQGNGNVYFYRRARKNRLLAVAAGYAAMEYQRAYGVDAEWTADPDAVPVGDATYRIILSRRVPSSTSYFVDPAKREIRVAGSDPRDLVLQTIAATSLAWKVWSTELIRQALTRPAPERLSAAENAELAADFDAAVRKVTEQPRADGEEGERLAA
jgi:hypothetical protein